MAGKPYKSSTDLPPGYGQRVPYASVYPLVSSRAVARPFTYEVPPEVEKGAVVVVRFHGTPRRGVVVALEEAAPQASRRRRWAMS